MIDQDILLKLVAIGESSSDEASYENLLEEISDRQEINVCDPSGWELALKKMEAPDVVSVLKGLTIAERRFRWCGGSVASSIWVFRYLYRIAQADASRDAAEWVAKHTSNRYSPFGTTRHASFDQWVYEQSDDFKNEQESRRLQFAAAEADARRSRLKRIHERQLRHQERREASLDQSARRAKELQVFREMSLTDQLERIAASWDRTLDYWPKSIARLPDTELESVPRSTLDMLLLRLSVKIPREWRGLRKRLRQLIS